MNGERSEKGGAAERRPARGIAGVEPAARAAARAARDGTGTMTTEYEALVAALDAGEPFGGGGDDGGGGGAVARIDTHAAHVFLVGELAYKLKRPVAFSFLDFSTIDARRRALENELRLNRRTAPELYRRVVPVTRADHGFALDGDGEVVDWVLEMRRFPQERKLDRIAAEGALDPALARELGAAVAAFHRDAERRPDKGGHAGMAAVVAGDREDLEAAPAEIGRAHV